MGLKCAEFTVSFSIGTEIFEYFCILYFCISSFRILINGSEVCRMHCKFFHQRRPNFHRQLKLSTLVRLCKKFHKNICNNKREHYRETYINKPKNGLNLKYIEFKISSNYNVALIYIPGSKNKNRYYWYFLVILKKWQAFSVTFFTVIYVLVLLVLCSAWNIQKVSLLCSDIKLKQTRLEEARPKLWSITRRRHIKQIT